MTTELHRPKFSFRWLTTSHFNDPYNDILWHIFWGIVIIVSVVYSIIVKDFLFLIISLIALIFFFHPFFYRSVELDITLDSSGIKINHNTYKWEEFVGFEIFSNEERYLIYFIPKENFHFGLTIPVDKYIPIEEIKRNLKEFLDEYINAVPLWERLYRNFFK